MTGWIFAAALRFVRGIAPGEPSREWADALLIVFLIQYISIGLLGMISLLTPWMILILAILFGAGLWFFPIQSPVGDQHASALLISATAVVLGYLLVLAWQQRPLPPVADDPLTYHIPAAVQWLQQGRIGLYETWLYNPANTYSPLAGSIFIAWWIAPMGNDVLSRFVQMPAVLLILFYAISFARACGAKMTIAILVATAMALTRPIIRQSILEKDDLYVAAFFIAAVAGLSPTLLRDRLGPWRAGAAIGLLLATKYTALLSLPLLLLAVDAPSQARWNWRQFAIAAAMILLLAGPWYLRNWVEFGNPIFPIDSFLFHGLFTMSHASQFNSAGGIAQALSKSYYALPPVLWIAVGVAWTWAVIRNRHRIIREPLVRIWLIGPIVGLAIFLWKSPYEEIRFVDPSLLLLLSSAAASPLAVAIVILILSISTNYILATQITLLPPVACVAILCTLATLGWRHSPRQIRLVGATLIAFTIGSLIFVYWPAYLISYRKGQAWRLDTFHFVPICDAWYFVRDELPPDERLAYANTYYTYPLCGFDLQRPLVYAPLSDRLSDLCDLPRISQPLRGDQVVPSIVRETIANADESAWLAHLRDERAGYLFVAKGNLMDAATSSSPVELVFAERDTTHFERVFDNPAASVFRIKWP